MSTTGNGILPSKRTATPLARLADMINAAHDAATAATEYTIAKWAAVGELLLEVKEEAGHGNFGAWVESSCRFGVRQAQKYIRIHERRAEIEASIKDDPDAVFGVDGAVSSVAAPKKPAQKRIENAHLPAADPGPTTAPPPAGGGKSLVNGVLQDDPPDVAARRAAGKIRADAVPEITDDGEATTVGDVAAEIEGRAATADDDLGDDDWLARLPLSGALKGLQLRTFREDALSYRRLEKARKAYGLRVAEEANRNRKIGPWLSAQRYAMKQAGPEAWAVCPPPEHDGCGGVGVLTLGPCAKCRGCGFWIPK